MRPEITGALEERIDRIYKAAGYGTATELVRDAVRNHLDRLEAQHYSPNQPERPFFEYRLISSDQHPTEIYLIPKDDSAVAFEPFKETVVLDTGTSYIGTDTLEHRIKQVDGVEHTVVTAVNNRIRIYTADAEDVDRDATEMVDDIYDVLSELIAESDRKVERGDLTRQESYRRAVRHD